MKGIADRYENIVGQLNDMLRPQYEHVFYADGKKYKNEIDAEKNKVQDDLIMETIEQVNNNPISYNPKNLYDYLYQDIGGLEGLKAKREAAGLQTKLSNDWYDEMGYHAPKSATESIFDTLNDSEDYKLSIKNDSSFDGVAGYKDKEKKIYLNFNEVNDDNIVDAFFHEMQHGNQNKEMSWFEKQQKNASYFPTMTNMILNRNDRDEFQKYYRMYQTHASEAQSFINGAMHEYQSINNKPLITPKDFEDFYEYGKKRFDDMGLPKSHILKIAPTLAKDNTEQDVKDILLSENKYA